MEVKRFDNGMSSYAFREVSELTGNNDLWKNLPHSLTSYNLSYVSYSYYYL